MRRAAATSKLGSLFIFKIVKSKPYGVEIGRWLELIFGLHERFIVQYEANRSFAIPGMYKPVPYVRLQGVKKGRVCKQNKRVWVRFDKKYPNVIDFEAPIGQSEEPEVFQLSREEWEKIKMWLIPVRAADREFHKRACC